MTDTNTKASLYRKIAAVAGAVGVASKDGRNKDQNYTYATPASVMHAVKPHMAEQHLAIVPHLIDFQEFTTGVTSRSGSAYTINRVTMHYHVLDGDTGEEMVIPWQAQAGTYGDDKGLAKAQTIALRTFLIQLFQVPAEDPEIDPDAGNPTQPARMDRPRPQAPTPQARRTSQEAPRRAEEADRVSLLAEVSKLATQAAQAKLTVSRTKALNAMTMPELLAHKAALIGALELAEGGSPQ